MDRRTFLRSTAVTSIMAFLGIPASASDGLDFGPEMPFSFDRLRDRARELARNPYRAPLAPDRELLDRVDYDALSKVRFKDRYALFANRPAPITFFHLGKYFPVPVKMYLLQEDGTTSREIIFDSRYFEIPPGNPAAAIKDNNGFGGFRVEETRADGKRADWAAFAGASYFRAIGALGEFGLSARGIAIDTAVSDKPEEFPLFTSFYFQSSDEASEAVTVYALLDGSSVSGAYRLNLQRTAGVLMDIETSLFLRQDVSRFGIAPLTSMFWFSETSKPQMVDWRPAVHDSDGLALWTGTGEHIWRPLNNPPSISASSFMDSNPRGFGLLQRDRNFDHYLDYTHYERRPSLWVEPLDRWGSGAVELIEIPTNDEIFDNIVAMWVPAQAAKAGSAFMFKYRLHWLADEPFPTSLARCVATRLGTGGQPGQTRPKGVRKFMVEFKGGPLEKLPSGVKPEAVVWSSRGKFSNVFTEPVPNDIAGDWLAHFDFTVSGTEPVDLRLFLRSEQETLSETWLYQYHPPRTVS
ncbi:MAG: glucan biosynthesis protein D [Verrucomicrobia bacterium]|nr:glucan biosynthesis protein D [Verrucomicrobiota bacterium]